MNEANTPASVSEDYLAGLIKARNRSAVLKTRLLTFKSGCPRVLVFVFEGPDDKIVYYHWIKRIEPSLRYEAFPLDGKGNVLDLFRVAKNDKADFADGVYFFIDRDFDDMRGHKADMRIFMTDLYSVENYLVTREVLADILVTDFHCNGHPAVRENICSLFEEVYAQFLRVTKDLNHRVFCARKLGIDLLKPLPTSARSLATITLTTVTAAEKLAEELVISKSGADILSEPELIAEFEKLEPRTRYRGKFALAFFNKWLLALADHYREENAHLFEAIDRKTKVKQEELTLGAFASKAQLPDGLSEFIGSMI